MARALLVASVGPGILLVASGAFAEDADAFTLPADIAGVGTALTALQTAADEAAMDQRRRERDKRIVEAKARSKKTLHSNAPRMTDERRADI